VFPGDKVGNEGACLKGRDILLQTWDGLDRERLVGGLSDVCIRGRLNVC
jgi:hypothetical protein